MAVCTGFQRGAEGIFKQDTEGFLAFRDAIRIHSQTDCFACFTRCEGEGSCLHLGIVLARIQEREIAVVTEGGAATRAVLHTHRCSGSLAERNEDLTFVALGIQLFADEAGAGGEA